MSGMSWKCRSFFLARLLPVRLRLKVDGPDFTPPDGLGHSRPSEVLSGFASDGASQQGRRQKAAGGSKGRPIWNADQVQSYALTATYADRYIPSMESAFAIIAEPSRRAILSLLASSERSVGDIGEQLRLPQPSVSKHLRVLREAGFVESTVDAQRRLYRLRPEPLQEVDAWLAPFRRFWSAHIDALERQLDRMDQSTLTKRKTRRRR
jgi:DNA-binding transcriptional ArsR family regulator